MNKREIKKQKLKTKKEIMEKYYKQKMIKVNDGYLWAPPYPKHQVCMTIGLYWNPDFNNGTAYISVHGMDDTSFEKRTNSDNLDDLINVWKEYEKFYKNIPQTTNTKYFLDRGFTYG